MKNRSIGLNSLGVTKTLNKQTNINFNKLGSNFLKKMLLFHNKPGILFNFLPNSTNLVFVELDGFAFEFLHKFSPASIDANCHLDPQSYS